MNKEDLAKKPFFMANYLVWSKHHLTKVFGKSQPVHLHSYPITTIYYSFPLLKRMYWVCRCDFSCQCIRNRLAHSAVNEVAVLESIKNSATFEVHSRRRLEQQSHLLFFRTSCNIYMRSSCQCHAMRLK